MQPVISSFVLSVRIVASLVMVLLVTPASADEIRLPVVGTGDGVGLLRALGSDFKQQAKSISIEVPPSIGSGGGIAAVGAGKEVLGRVARKLKTSEIESGIIYVPFARLPTAIFVHPGVGVAGLTTDQLISIYTGRVTNWSELGGANLRMRVVRREDSDSSLIVLRAMMPGWKDIKITEKSKMAMTTQESIATVRDVTGTIGFAPYSTTLEPGVKVLKINGRHPLDAGYPSSVELALIYKKDTVTPAARAFVDYVKSPKAHAVIMRMGSVPAQ